MSLRSTSTAQPPLGSTASALLRMPCRGTRRRWVLKGDVRRLFHRGARTGGACSHFSLGLVFHSHLWRCVSLLDDEAAVLLHCFTASLLHCCCQLDNLLGPVVSAYPALCLLTSPAGLPRPETPVSRPCAKPPNESGGNLAIHCCKRAQTRQRTDSSVQGPVSSLCTCTHQSC